MYNRNLNSRILASFGVIAFLLIAASASASDVKSWTCSARTGLMGAATTRARLEKTANGYSLFLTDSSSDVGPQWRLNDELVATGLDCKFSKTHPEPLYCSSMSDGWITITAEKESIDSVDQDSGEDHRTTFTSIIISGTSKVLKVYDSAVAKFGATSCTRD